MTSFNDFGLKDEILTAILELGYVSPTPIQEKIIPILLKEKIDIIGLAQTGTGKTAAFGLPLANNIDLENRQTQVLVLSPTRELCIQIASDIKSYTKFIPALSTVAVYGGSSIDRQIQSLRRGAQIIVATPGRMNDLLNRRNQIDVSNLQTLVLDEADEMLNMGFKEELDAILERTPETKNTLLFSATMPSDVMKISKNYMSNPREVVVGNKNSGAENVEHLCYTVRSRDRYLALKRIVDSNPEIYGIIFCKTRMETKNVAEKLLEDGYNVDALHGDLSQSQREYVMNRFRIKNLQLVIATDVAARGLDVKDLTHIINYDLPQEMSTYTHRSGRTGRAGKKGTSIVIINLREKGKIRRIEHILNKKFTYKDVPTGIEICQKQLMSSIDKMQNIEINHKEIDPFLPVIYEKLEWLSREDLIKHFVSVEFNRFLDYYKNAPDLKPERERSPRDRRDRDDFQDRSDSRNRNRRDSRTDSNFTTLFFNIGIKDAITPRDFIGLINRNTRGKNIEIGRIQIQKTFSFVDVDSEFADYLIEHIKGVEFQGKSVHAEISTASKSNRSSNRRSRNSNDSSRNGRFNNNRGRR